MLLTKIGFRARCDPHSDAAGTLLNYHLNFFLFTIDQIMIETFCQRRADVNNPR